MKNDLERLMSNATKRCEGMILEECRGFFGRIYPFTTENINGYIDLFPLRNKSLLTVGSSGDQVLNAILKGCQDINVLDINPYTKYYYYLKVAGIISLDYDDFLEFFRFKDYPKVFKDNWKVFNPNLYRNIAPILKKIDTESYLFWDHLFTSFSARDIRRYLFQMDEDRNETIMGCNLYLKSKTNYDILKSIVAKVKPNFINNSIFQYHFSKNYDNIWLSNIGAYLDIGEIQKITTIAKKGLSSSGNLMVSYLYDTTKGTIYDKRWSPIYNINQMNFIFSNYSLELLSFLGVKGIKFEDNHIKDSVLLCRKKIK